LGFSLFAFVGIFDAAMRKLTPTRKTYDRVTPKKSKLR